MKTYVAKVKIKQHRHPPGLCVYTCVGFPHADAEKRQEPETGLENGIGNGMRKAAGISIRKKSRKFHGSHG